MVLKITYFYWGSVFYTDIDSMRSDGYMEKEIDTFPLAFGVFGIQ